MVHNTCPICGCDDWSDYGDQPCMCSQQSDPREQPYPEPTLTEVCFPHAYYGDDEEGGRCYCGEKRYPVGGTPTSTEVHE